MRQLSRYVTKINMSYDGKVYNSWLYNPALAESIKAMLKDHKSIPLFYVTLLINDVPAGLCYDVDFDYRSKLGKATGMYWNLRFTVAKLNNHAVVYTTSDNSMEMLECNVITHKKTTEYKFLNGMLTATYDVVYYNTATPYHTSIVDTNDTVNIVWFQTHGVVRSVLFIKDNLVFTYDFAETQYANYAVYCNQRTYQELLTDYDYSMHCMSDRNVKNKVLLQHNKPTICYNYIDCYTALTVCHKRKLKLPEDEEVIYYKTTETYDKQRIELTKYLTYKSKKNYLDGRYTYINKIYLLDYLAAVKLHVAANSKHTRFREQHVDYRVTIPRVDYYIV